MGSIPRAHRPLSCAEKGGGSWLSPRKRNHTEGLGCLRGQSSRPVLAPIVCNRSLPRPESIRELDKRRRLSWSLFLVQIFNFTKNRVGFRDLRPARLVGSRRARAGRGRPSAAKRRCGQRVASVAERGRGAWPGAVAEGLQRRSHRTPDARLRAPDGVALHFPHCGPRPARHPRSVPTHSGLPMAPEARASPRLLLRAALLLLAALLPVASSAGPPGTRTLDSAVGPAVLFSAHWLVTLGTAVPLWLCVARVHVLSLTCASS